MINTAANPGVESGNTATEAAAPVPAPVLITEQQVLIGSAAALAAPTTYRQRLLTSIRARFARAEKTDRPKKRRHYPVHYDFIEDAAMSRMMYRL